MTRSAFCKFAVVAAAVAATAGPAAAQPPQAPAGFGGGAARPSYSPYLNLLRQGSPGYLNYYGLVRPQQQTQQALGALQTQSQTNATGLALLAAGEGGTGVTTGKGFGYMTHRSYFLNNGGGGSRGAGGASGGGGGGSAPRGGTATGRSGGGR